MRPKSFHGWRRRRAAARLAGRSAEEKFAEGLRAYRKRVRLAVAPLAGGCMVGGAILALSLDGSWVFVGGVLAGFGFTCFLWVDDSPPAYIEQWRQGYEGERKTAKALARLDAPWRVFHDQLTDTGNRDHIAVGP